MVLGEQENKQKRPVPFFRLSKTKKNFIFSPANGSKILLVSRVKCKEIYIYI